MALNAIRDDKGKPAGELTRTAAILTNPPLYLHSCLHIWAWIGAITQHYTLYGNISSLIFQTGFHAIMITLNDSEYGWGGGVSAGPTFMRLDM